VSAANVRIAGDTVAARLLPLVIATVTGPVGSVVNATVYVAVAPSPTDMVGDDNVRPAASLSVTATDKSAATPPG